MAKQYNKKYLPCKGVQHHWDEYTPAAGEFRRPEFGSRWIQKCDNCGGLRHRLVNRITGALLDTNWQYRMPEDFKPATPMTRQDFRRKYLRQQTLIRNQATGAKLRKLRLVG